MFGSIREAETSSDTCAVTRGWSNPQLPLFLQAFTWVDLRNGLTNDRIDRLVWGITGVKPGSTAPASVQPNPQPVPPAQQQILVPQPATPTRLPNEQQILAELKRLIGAQFEEVVFLQGATNVIPGKNAPQAERAIELIGLARSKGHDGLKQLWKKIQQVKGNTP